MALSSNVKEALSSKVKERMSAGSSNLLGPTGYLRQTYNGDVSAPTSTYETTFMYPQRSFPPPVDYGIELPVIDPNDVDNLLPATNVLGNSNVGAAAIPGQNDEISVSAIQPSNQSPVTNTNTALSAVSNTLNSYSSPESFAQQFNMHHLYSPTTLPASLNPLPPNTPPTFGTPVASPAVLQPTQFQIASPLTTTFHGKRVGSSPVIPNSGNGRWVK